MGKIVKVLTAYSELNTGIAQKSENFVGTNDNEDMLVNDMYDKVSDSLYCTRAFKSKEKGLQCFVVSEPLKDFDDDYKITCEVKTIIVLRDDIIAGKEMELFEDKPWVDRVNELLGEAGLKEQIIEENNALIDEVNRRSEGISFTVLDSNEDGCLPEWGYNNGKYLVAVNTDSEYRDYYPMHWKDASVHLDHITEETFGMYYDTEIEDTDIIRLLLKQSKERNNVERE